MKKQHHLSLFIVFSMIMVFLVLNTQMEAKAKTPTYIITPSSKPYNVTYSKYSTYNQHTKHYYVLRSYLERFEKTKGGKLILKKGTYTISNTLYVPSNVTIQLENGAKLVKGTKTGTSQFKAASSMFQLIAPSKSSKKGVYGKYNGEKNIQFIGKGTATIDLNYVEKGIGIIMGHNQNVLVDRIQFRHMNYAHFIEMDASKNVTVKNSTFKYAKDPLYSVKEAINLDTPDRSTKGWSQEWSKFDAQPNSHVLIENNTFEDIPRAVGTHKYSYKKLHDRITIRQNKMVNLRSDYIRALNWSNAVIEKNTFTMSSKNKRNEVVKGIAASGTKNPTIRNNTFNYMAISMMFFTFSNTGGGTTKKVFADLSKANKEALMTNTFKNLKTPYIQIRDNIQSNGSRKTETIRLDDSVLR